jgi:ribonuclease BN (tRNA processing enzyme)
MIFTVIGSGTALPSRERGSPCHHLRVGSDQVVFDLGSGSVRQLWKRGVDVRDVTVLALSHFHPDHTADLVPLLFALRNPEFARPGRLKLLGPRGLKEYFGSLEKIFADWIHPPALALTIEETTAAPFEFGDWRVEVALTGHTADSVAFRVESSEGSSVVYGGDSSFSESVIELAQGASLLVLECSFPEGHPAEGHLTPSRAALMASRAGVPRLLLTHFYPEAEGADLLSPARQHYAGELLLAVDGLTLEV